MEAVCIIIGILLLIVFGGLLGWIVKLIGYIFEFLLSGLSNLFVCLFWIIIIIVLLIGFSASC